MTSRLSIKEKMSTFLDEMNHIMLECAMLLHGHWNKVVPVMNPFIFTNLNNGVQFCNYTYWLINDNHSHHLSC